MKTPVCVSIVTKSCSDRKQGCKMGILRTGGVPKRIQTKLSIKEMQIEYIHTGYLISKCDILNGSEG